MLRSESKTRTHVSAFFLCRRIGFMLQKECKLYLVEAWLLLLLEKNILWHLTPASQPELSLSGHQSLLFRPRLSRLLLHARNCFHTIVHYLTPLIPVLLIPPFEQAPPFWSKKLISPHSSAPFTSQQKQETADCIFTIPVRAQVLASFGILYSMRIVMNHEYSIDQSIAPQK